MGRGGWRRQPALGSGTTLGVGTNHGAGPTLGAEPALGAGPTLGAEPALGAGPTLGLWGGAGPHLGHYTKISVISVCEGRRGAVARPEG